MLQFHLVQQLFCAEYLVADEVDMSNARRIAFFNIDANRNPVTWQFFHTRVDGSTITALCDVLSLQLQADALGRLLELQAEVGMDDEQTRRAGALVDAEIDAILDLQQDAMDGVPPEELAGELLATFEATEAEAGTFLEGDQLDAFIAMRRAG